MPARQRWQSLALAVGAGRAWRPESPADTRISKSLTAHDSPTARGVGVIIIPWFRRWCSTTEPIVFEQRNNSAWVAAPICMYQADSREAIHLACDDAPTDRCFCVRLELRALREAVPALVDVVSWPAPLHTNPAAQGLHSVDSATSWYFPLAQTEQVVAAIARLARFPSGHSLQS